MRFKYFVPVLLCFVHFSNCKPTANYITEGRGVGSTLWGWITYPFSWWGSSAPEPTPVNDHLVGPAPYGPYDNIEIARRNVTVWCNDQTCTTMKCDRFGCKNVTCNIYDTDMKGECREYNTEVPAPVPPKPTQPEQILPDKVTISTEASTLSTASAPTSTLAPSGTPPQVEEHPLELEVALSSTITENSRETVSSDAKENKSSSPQNKV